MVFTGEALDRYLEALNQHIQDKYLQEDLLAGLIEERAPEFATAAAASAAVPTPEEAPSGGAFGYVVFDGRSLSSGLELFNAELALRGEDAFALAGRETAVKGAAFAAAASSAGLDAKMAARRRQATGLAEGFGDAVSNDASLDASMVALKLRLRDRAAREAMLTAAVRPVDSDSFDAAPAALALSF
ncbi:MAG: hypothetical protein QNJ67_12260 [Kiloniellales bacterium]|nr:hypothetical protein [Kiloniellales bacterium]